MHSRHFFITEKNTMNPGQTSKKRRNILIWIHIVHENELLYYISYAGKIAHDKSHDWLERKSPSLTFK